MSTPVKIDPTDAMIPVAASLACAVAEYDKDTITRTLTKLKRSELYALVILYAAHVDLDAPMAGALSPQGIVAHAVRSAATSFDTTYNDIMGRSNLRNVREARVVAMAACRRAGMSSPVVGEYFGRDHTTVLHATTRVGEDPRLRRIADRILETVGAGEFEEQVA